VFHVSSENIGIFVKFDLMNMLQESEQDELDPFRIKFARLAPIPKENDASTMKKVYALVKRV